MPTVLLGFGVIKKSKPLERLVLKSRDIAFKNGFDMVRFVGRNRTDVLPLSCIARRN